MDLREASLGFYRVWHAAWGARHGLFQERAKTPVALARAAGLDARAVAKWCRGAHALGLLEQAGGSYRVAPRHARRLAREGDVDSLARHVQYLAQKSLTFGGMDDLLRGKPTRPDLAEAYALATGWDHLAFFEIALPRDAGSLALFREGADVLDLGAGNGAWAGEAQRRFPRVRVQAAETRTGLPRLRRALRGSDIATMDTSRVPGSSFDVVFLGEVLAASDDPRAPLETAFRALRPGGRLHLMEGLLPPAGRAPRGWGERLVLAMDLDFGMDGSRFLTRADVDDALRRAGFVRRGFRDVGGSLFHVRAAKPKRSREARRQG